MNSSNELSKEKTGSKNIFRKLKSDYFLQKLFNILLKIKSLYIIKYNNNIKYRLNISIKDYKEYSEIYSSIEIEIKPVNNKYGKFINMNESENVEKSKIIIDYQIKSLERLFKDCEYIEYICFKHFYRNTINNMRYMFCGCSPLKELNLSNFNTNNVSNMRSMFWGCSSLKELNLSNFNTNNVTDMEGMFYGCSDQFLNKIRSEYKNIKEEAFNEDKDECDIY